MQTSLKITFLHMAPSPALEEDVRRCVDELETCFERMISCRVVIEAPHHHQHHGGLYGVRLEIGVPGHRLMVTRSPDHHAVHEDGHVAVRDAFRAARRELEDHARRIRGEVKRHVGPPHGRVVHLEPSLAYGRISTADGREIYFHRNSVIGGIERLRLEGEVRYHEEPGDKGPQASTVEPIGEHGHHAA